MRFRLRKGCGCLVAALLISYPLNGHAQASKFDARLRSRLPRAVPGGHAPAGVGPASAPAPESTKLFRVFVSVAPGMDLAALRAAHPAVVFGSFAGGVATARATAAGLAALAADARVGRIEAPAPLRPSLDAARSNSTSGGLFLGTTLNGPADLASIDGTGVVVGVVDTGLDFHHLDFINDGANTSRVKYLWDQTVDGAAPGVIPGAYGYGTEYTQAQLTADLQGGTAVTQVDRAGHGTHVAGIAAGDGSSSGSGYVGMAPKADIIFVKTCLEPALDSCAQSGTDIPDAIEYIITRAQTLGKRAVINLSLGSQMGPHDGKSLFDTQVAAYAASTPIVVAMGNEHEYNIHAQTVIPANGSIVFTLSLASGTIQWTDIEFWHHGGDAYTATVSVGGGGNVAVASGVDDETGTSASHSVYVYNGTNAQFDYWNPGHPATTDKQIFIEVEKLDPRISAKTVAITLTRTSAGGNGRVDGYADYGDGEGTRFTSYVSNTGTLGSPATADNVITVGSYISKWQWTDSGANTRWYTDTLSAGGISGFSGRGPTRDGRQKPDVVAPGAAIASAMSADTSPDAGWILADLKHRIMRGTSMAAPFVTGLLAARMQNAPWRTVALLRDLLRGSARADAATGAVPNDNAGYGKVLATPLTPVSAPTGLAGAALGVSSITWTWDNTLLHADSYNFYSTAGNSLGVFPAITKTGLAANTDYPVTLYGVGGGLEGSVFAFGTVATLATPPGSAPTAIPASSSAAFTYAAYASAPPGANSCYGYSVQVSATSDFSGTIYSSATPARTLTRLEVSGLAQLTQYYARLGALNSQGFAHYGPPASFTTTTSLLPPASVSLDNISTGSVRFNWSQGTNPPNLSYQAQASSTNFASSSQTITVQAYAAGFAALQAATSYYFRVQALAGPLSTAGPVSTLARAPSLSTNTFAAADATSLTVSWGGDGNGPETLYQAEVSQASDFSSGVVSSATRNGYAVLSGLTPNKVYYARAMAYSHSGILTAYTSLGSTSTWVLPPTLPGEPFSGQATDGFSFTFVNPGNPAGTRYLVEISKDSDFSALVASSNTAGTTAAFSGLVSNQLYYAHAAALNQVGAPTTFTAPAATATLVAAPLAAPVGISTRTVSVFGAAWTRGTLAAGTNYRAQASSSPAFAFNVLSSVTANEFASFAGLDSNTTYFVRVQAVSLNAPTPDGPFLSAASGATLAKVPSAADVAFPQVFFTSAAVSWTPLVPAPSSCAAQGYLVELSPSSDFSALLYSTRVPSGVSVATVTGLSYATTYYARVGSVNLEGLASYLVVGSTLTRTPPLSSGTVTGGGLALTLPPAFPQFTSVSLYVPAGAFPAGTVVTAVAEMGVSLIGSNSNEASIVPFDNDISLQISAGGLQPSSPVRVTFVYDPAQIPAGQDERRLHLLRYDPAAGQWTLIPSQTDVRSRTLTAFVPHFSLFAPFFVTPSSDLSTVQVWPQPWEIGDPSSAYWASALTFASLPAGARVRFFTVTGEVVWDGEASPAGVLTWDGKTRFAGKAASGTYIAVIEGAGARLVRRVVLIR